MKGDDQMFQQYQLTYAEHHRIPAHWILEQPELELAAFLEHMILTHVMSVTDARRRFVKEFPKSNRLPVSRKIIYPDNTFIYDEKYAFGSVLNLITGWEDSIFV